MRRPSVIRRWAEGGPRNSLTRNGEDQTRPSVDETPSEALRCRRTYVPLHGCRRRIEDCRRKLRGK